ncbi:MAG TPA: acyltransferase [Pyrinomonadaceae bacterium]|jgi:peptidoglycan/LPS O-acetylase OafA/YrhL
MENVTEGKRIGRVLSLDAMRGAAAIGVVLYHALGVAPLTAPGGWQWWLPKWTSALVHFGYAGVFLFFVISGFCIHLFWARARAGGLENPRISFVPFWKRRVRRLYPAYLAALALYLVHMAYQTPLKVTGFYLWDVCLHLLMLHNFDPRTTYSINSAFWTLAIEEQLYLAYFLLLFLRIRYGWARTLTVCLAARVVWLVLGRSLVHFSGIDIPVSEAAATNWFIWALGALSVEAALGIVKLPAWCSRLWVGLAALLCAMGLAEGLPLIHEQAWLHDAGWLLMHPAWGLGFFVLVNCAVRAEQRWQERRRRAPRLVLWLAPVGLISYSLYLTHLFVLMKWYWFGFTRWHILSISLLVMTPLSLLFAWLFFRLFERPFMPRSASVRDATEQRGRGSDGPPQPAEAVSDPVAV